VLETLSFKVGVLSHSLVVQVVQLIRINLLQNVMMYVHCTILEAAVSGERNTFKLMCLAPTLNSHCSMGHSGTSQCMCMTCTTGPTVTCIRLCTLAQCGVQSANIIYITHSQPHTAIAPGTGKAIVMHCIHIGWPCGQSAYRCTLQILTYIHSLKQFHQLRTYVYVHV